MILFIKGLIIGMGKILPGVSGGVLALSLGVYDKTIDILNHIFIDFKNNIKYLFFLGLGIIISIILGSNVIKFFLNKYYLPTMLLFIGLMIGGIPNVYDKIKYNISIKSIIFLLFLGLFTLFVNRNMPTIQLDLNNYFIIMLLGFIDAVTMIIPGISGTLIMMLLGAYTTIINSLSIADISFMIPFFMGIFLGVILLIKVIDYFLKKHEIISYFIIFFCMTFSIITLFINCFSIDYNVSTLIISFINLIIGIFVGYKLDCL